MSRATDIGERPPRSGSVTTAISPPLLVRTSSMIAVIARSDAGSTTPAKSFT
jgi:hypothetical protein